MKSDEFNEWEVQALFTSALQRSGKGTANPATIKGIMQQAYGGSFGDFNALIKEVTGMPKGFALGDIPDGAFQPPPNMGLDQYRPDTSLSSMPAREFVGPKIGTAHLFPLASISLFTALGGVGKTTSLISIGAHIAAGLKFGVSVLQARRVLMIFVEEGRDELNRKFGATTHDWDEFDRGNAADNTRLVSMVGEDPRLTLRCKNGVMISPLVSQITEWGQQFKAELIILDHLQGFVDGDLNSSDTATMAAMAANQIMAGTGAAVVFAAHVNKGQIDAESVGAGFTSGSLAFENAARQVTGAIRLTENRGKEFGISDVRDCILMEMPKNSYGPPGQALILQKEYVHAFHTVRVVPVSQGVALSTPFTSPSKRLAAALSDYIKEHPGTTRAKLDGLSGKDGRFKASKNDVRRTVEEMLDDEVLRKRAIDTQERKALRLSHQVKEILEIAP